MSHNLPLLNDDLPNTSTTFTYIITSRFALLTEQLDQTSSPGHTIILRTLTHQFQDHITILLNTLQTHADNQRTLTQFIPSETYAVPTVEATPVPPTQIHTSSSVTATFSLPPAPFPTSPHRINAPNTTAFALDVSNAPASSQARLSACA